MPLVLVRIDDRLVHGQVVIAWGLYLNASKIILCNDEIAQSEIEKQLFMNAEEIAPQSLKISVLTQKETLTSIQSGQYNDDNVILIIESPQDLLNLVRAGLNIETVNVGGMHYRHGKRQLAAYIYVNENDISCFRKLDSKGIQLEGRDVPVAKKIDIVKQLNQW